VRPVLLFPGWYVNQRSPGVEVRVLNEKAFVKFLNHEPTQLSNEQQHSFASALARYMRGRDQR